MGKYVEDTDNLVFQAFSEFNEYLIAMYLFHTSKDKKICNISLTALRLHSRAIAAFFQKSRKYKDDLLYLDLINTEKDYSIAIPEDVKTYINKTTAHISKKRGKIELSDIVFFEYQKSILFAIKNYMEEFEKSLKPEYKNDYSSQDVNILEKLINDNLIKVAELLIK